MQKDYFEREKEFPNTHTHKGTDFKNPKTRRRRTTATIMKSNKHDDDK